MEKVGVQLVAQGKADFVGALKDATSAIDNFVKSASGAGSSVSGFGAALSNISSQAAGFKLIGQSFTEVANAATPLSSAMSKVGSASSSASGDLKNADGGAKSAASALIHLGSTAASAAAKGFADVAGAAAGVVGKLADVATHAATAAGKFSIGFGKESVSAAMEFDASISGVAATIGLTGKDLDKFLDQAQKTALELGAKYPVSAKDAADAMGEMAKAGFDANTVLHASAGVVQLASATHYDMAKSATILANAMNGFGLVTTDATETEKNAMMVTDLLAKTANASAVDVSDLSETMKYCAPAAKAAGFSIQDVSIAMGLMGNAGIKGSAAGTGLNTILTQLASPGDKAAAAFEKLGHKTKDAAGNIIPLRDQLVDLRAKFATLSAADKIDMAKMIAGQNHFTKFLAMIDQSPESIQNMTDAIDHAQNAGADMAKVMNDNLAGSVENMKGSIETLQIKLGKALTPAVRVAADGMAYLANAAGPLADKLAGPISKGVDIAKSAFSDFIAGIKGVSDMSGAVLGGSGDGGPANLFFKLGQTISTQVIPAIQNLITTFGPVATTIYTVWSNLQPLHMLFTVFTGFLNGGVMGALTAFENSLITVGQALGIDVQGPLGQVNNVLFGVVVPGFNNFVSILTGQVVPAVMGFASQAANVFVNVVLPAASSFFGWIATNVGPILTSMADTFTGTVLPAAQKFGDFIVSDVLPKLGDLAKWIGDNVVPVLEKLASFIAGTVVPTIGALVATVMTSVIPTLTNWFSVIATVLAPVLEKLANFITTGVIPAATQIAQFITGTVVPAFNQMASFVNANVMPVLTTLAGYLGGALSTAFDNIGTVVKFVWDQIQVVINTAWGVIQGIWNTIAAVLRGDLTGAFNGIGQIVDSIWHGIQSTISNAWTMVQGVWNNMVDGVGNLGKSITNKLGDVIDWFIALPGKIADAIASLPGQMLKAGGDAIGGFIKGFSNIHIPLPHFNISMGEGPFGVPMPNVSVNWYAQGGVFNAPTIAGIGDSPGGEAALPLRAIGPLMSDALVAAIKDLSRPGADSMVAPAMRGGPVVVGAGSSTTDARQYVLNVNSSAPTSDIANQFYIMQALTI